MKHASAYVLNGFTVYLYDRVSSTADMASRDEFQNLVRNKGPVIIVAKEQTCGRGRFGKTWQTLAGNLSCNIVFAFGPCSKARFQVSFVMAVAIFEVIKNLIGTKGIVLIKWPNDILVNGAKIAGMLIDSLPHTLSVGLGINVDRSPILPSYPTTYIRSIAPSVTDDQVLYCVVEKVKFWMEVFQREGIMPTIIPLWKSRLKGIGERVIIRTPIDQFCGVLWDVSDAGSISLRMDNGCVKSFSSGEIIFG